MVEMLVAIPFRAKLAGDFTFYRVLSVLIHTGQYQVADDELVARSNASD